jgi:hypothetical protein
MGRYLQIAGQVLRRRQNHVRKEDGGVGSTSSRRPRGPLDPTKTFLHPAQNDRSQDLPFFYEKGYQGAKSANSSRASRRCRTDGSPDAVDRAEAACDRSDKSDITPALGPREHCAPGTALQAFLLRGQARS